MSVQTTIDVNVNSSGVTSLRAELKKTVAELQQLEVGTAKFDELNAKAAGIRDKMSEVNEQIAVMASGSKYEKVSNSLGEIGAGLRDMDFDRVTQGAKLFSQTAKAITFKDAMGSFKQMGSAMASVGKTILMNPLFIIAGVIIGIGVAVYKLLEKMGVMKKIFEAVGGAINWVTQQIKDFLDWIGLTTFAAEDAAEKQAAAQEKIAASYADKRDKVTDAYDHDIRMAKIAGENTVSMERQKQYAIIKTSQEQYNALLLSMDLMKKSGDLTKEKADEIKKQLGELRKGIHEARQEVQGINAQEVADNKAANEKKHADNVAAAKAANEKRKQEAQKRKEEQKLALENERKFLAEMHELLMESLAKSEQARKDHEAKIASDIVAANDYIFSLMEEEEQKEFKAREAADDKERALEQRRLEEAKAMQDARYFLAESAVSALQNLENLLKCSVIC